ncbi:hypothetical protein AB2N08_14035 [Massilia aurea]|uniref:hypothetical protein n=1 Tax=Massilia aurea TaxID=373040 RepID=UPI0034623476
MTPIRSRHSLPCLVLTSFAGLASAQQDYPGTPVAQVDIKGSSATYDPRRDDTATRIVVGRDELIRYGDRSLLDALKRVPGVTATSVSQHRCHV